MSVDLQDLSRRLFATANQLWTNTALRPDQYAQPVLALIALRQMEAKFDAVHAILASTFTGRLKPTPADYQARGAIYLPDNARYSYLLGLPETSNLAEAINTAMKSIMDANPTALIVSPSTAGDGTSWCVLARARARSLAHAPGDGRWRGRLTRSAHAPAPSLRSLQVHGLLRGLHVNLRRRRVPHLGHRRARLLL